MNEDSFDAAPESDPYCIHYETAWDRNRMCACGHTCSQHEPDAWADSYFQCAVEGCACNGWVAADV